MSDTLIPGYATGAATQAYVKKQGRDCARGHYSDFLHTGILLSSIGVGTFPGLATDEIDDQMAAIVASALQAGLNVVDTAAHYRYGRSSRAVGRGLRAALAAGVPREAMFLVSKGGFLRFPDGPPADIPRWFEEEIAALGLGQRAEVAGKVHLLTPAHIEHQIELSRREIGVETLDAFLVDQPEVQIPDFGKPELIRKLDKVFVALERAVQAGHIRYYGVSSFNSFRVHTDEAVFLSIASLLGLAERAAHDVWGDNQAPHHLAIVQMPFNGVMLEGFTRFNQVTGQGNEVSTLQAALQLKLFTMASHTLFKGHLAKQSIDVVQQALPTLKNPAQRAIQFNRSTPGLGTSLVGMSTPAHLEDALAVARLPLMPRQAYLSMYQKAQ
jgi:aryl-alcohol dehydrogenase-like predicted oxidoreductase